MGEILTGRKVIYTNQNYIDRSNVVDVLKDAIKVHTNNCEEIQYLYDYYKGNQPILNRIKEVRAEICNKIVENRANEIVSFKSAYLMYEPIQYVSRGGGDDETSRQINMLNEFVYSENKAAKDKELVDWFTICGTSYRMTLPATDENNDDSPFNIYILDPRTNFVVYYTGLGNKRVMSVTLVSIDDNKIKYCVYTDNSYFEIIDSKIVLETVNGLGVVPIIEYPGNIARLGAFEIVLPILDAINTTISNRLDSVEQFIQAILVLKGVDIEDDGYKALKKQGGLKIPLEADAKYLVQELNQSQTQTLIDDMYKAVLTICGMPSMSDGTTSDSSNNGAIILRNGWYAAEARAKDTELMFKKSEKEFLKIVIKITNQLRGTDLKLSDIDVRFTRRNYENIQEKSQVLTTMLANDKIHPRLAFEHSGLFVDPELAYTESLKYAQEKEAELLAQLKEASTHEDVQDN